MNRQWVASIAALLMLVSAGCRVRVDKDDNGKDKNVKIDTPMGGLHVRSNGISAADVGLPAYPGASIDSSENNKSADVHLGFGEWQLRVKAVTYDTSDPQDKVIPFYQKALGRYGDVIQCRAKQPVGTPTVTREGLDCADDGKHGGKVDVSSDSELELKAGSKHHQHIVAIKTSDDTGSRFSLIELQLPSGLGSDDSKGSN
jgi:hypothetical protein